MKIIIPVIFLAILIPSLIIVAYIAHQNRWYIEYRWARYKLIKKTVRSENDKFKYDAFVSYNHNDSDFVHDILTKELESKAGLRLCLQERDFQVGKSIIENIVDCLESSRSCIIVLSEGKTKHLPIVFLILHYF